MSDLWGFAAGQHIRAEDDRMGALAQMQVDEGNQRIQSAQIASQMQQKMLDSLNKTQSAAGDANSSVATPHTDDLSRTLQNFAIAAADAGMPDKAKQYAEASSTIEKNTVEIADKQLEQTIKQANIAASLFANVNDEQSWREANHALELVTGVKSKYIDTPYNPQLVDNLKQGIQSVKDRAQIDADKARVKDIEMATREKETRIALIAAQTRETEQRKINLSKAGGTAAVATASDLKAITDLVIKDFGAGVPMEDARVLARPVAERMKQLIKQDGMAASEAATKAYQEAKEDGTFGGLRPRPAMSGTTDKPLALPMVKGKIDRNQLRENMWYDVNGTPRLLRNGQLYTKEELGGNK